jgi:DNA adenine methylase
MQATASKLRGPTKHHGGKAYLARRIIAYFPPHRIYLECFAGGLSILLNKPRSKVEVAGDLNLGLIRMWQTLRDHGSEVLRRLVETPYTEEAWRDATLEVDCSYEIEHAVAFIVANRMSRGGLGKSFAWSERLRGGQPGDKNAWETMIRDDLPRVIDRIRDVRFEHGDALRLIDVFKGDREALIYADPPYLPATRTHRKAYACEMTREEHEVLLAQLRACKAKVFLSGYRDPLYDEALVDWTRHEFEIANHSGQGRTKQRRVECLWENHP